MRPRWWMPYFEAEGVGAGGAPASGAGASDAGAAADTPDLVKAAAEADKQGGDAAAKPGADAGNPAGAGTVYWPDGLPETLNGFKGTSDRETIDKLAGHLKGLPQPPAKPEDYKLALPAEFVKRYGDLGNDEVLPIWRQIAHKNGMSEQQFNGAISELYSELSEKGLLDETIDVMAELEKLSPKHGDPLTRKAAASARINGVANTINGLVGRQVLSRSEGNIVLALAARAEGVMALEKLFKAASEHGLQGGGQGGAQQGTEHERAMRSMFPSMHQS
jgi:hypothetical protein